MRKKLPAHMPWLDGLRGVAALWVVCHHVHILVGAPHFPVISWGALAVDLFMMVSGFLMGHHYLLRRERAPWGVSSTWTEFWGRRWFRLSPLFYLLLAVALMVGPSLGEYRAEIASHWPSTATAPERYTDSSWLNLFAHLTYIFGAIPGYSFRTALPDWSIGLEAQFYLAFPFIMLLMARVGVISAGMMLAVICLAIGLLAPGFMSSFPMPSFLPLKLYVFVVGIWIAYAQISENKPWLIVAAILLTGLYAFLEWSAEAVARVGVVLAFWSLADEGVLLRTLGPALGSRVGRFMGDTSYALYLAHLLLVIPIAALLSRQPAFVSAHWMIRLAICAALVVPAAYALAYILFKAIEQPGIKLGKRLMRQGN